jgi:hypothetical protein
MAGADEKPRADSQEAFLSRWSRLKEEARQAPPATTPATAPHDAGPAPELPSLDELTPESDFRAFFHPKVGEEVRRAALKKLFSDPRFNVMDGLDVYIDDYSKTEPIPEAMMKGLRQAQMILASAREDTEERERAARLAQAAPDQALEPPGQSSIEEAGLQVNAENPAPVPVAADRVDDTTKT